MPTSRQLAYASLFFVVAGLAFSIGLFNTAVSVLIGLALISVILRRDFAVFRGPFLWFLLAYLAMNLVSLTQTDYPMTSARGIVKVLKNLFLCLSVVYVVDSEDKFRRIFQWILTVAVVISIDALIQGATGVELIRGRDMTAFIGETKRITGPFRHANDFAAFLSFVLILFLAVVARGFAFFSRRQYAFFVAGAALLAVCLLGTYSRGAWLAVAVAAGLYALITRSRVLIGLMLLAGLGGFLFSPPLVKARVLSIFDGKDGTIHSRKELWAESGRMIRQSPWLGLGVNTYARNEPAFKVESSPMDRQYAHNGYLQIAAEIGLLGLASFLAVFLYFLASSLGAFLKSPPGFLRMAGVALLFGILSFLIHSATDTNLQSVLLVNTLWFAKGLAWAARRIGAEARAAQRILFVRTDRMGDLLMNLPAVRLLRQAYPKAWIALLADARSAELVKGHPDLDEVITVDAAALKSGFRARLDLARRLREARFDLAVLSNPDKWLHFIAFLADIPERIGWRHKWAFLLSKSRSEPKDKTGRHQTEWNLDLAALVTDKKWDGRMMLPVDESAKRRVEERLRYECAGESGVIAVHPGTSNPAKRWSEEKFAELCRRLEAEGFRIVLIGGGEVHEAAQRIASSCGAAVNWAGALSLAELTAFLGNARVKLLISSDSGPVHIAWIRGTPVVALYAKNDPGSNPVRWGPRDALSEAIHKPIDQITPAEVFKAAVDVLQKKRDPAPC
jgi:heptosyltransferase-2